MALLSILALVLGPECQIVSQKLHDERAVLVVLLLDTVQVSNGSVKRVLGNIDGIVGFLSNLVEEHREVQSQSQANGMSE
jgi:hypothetical protein